METAFLFSATLASNTAWAHMHFCYCLPGAACALLSDSMEEREITMNALRRIIDAIQRLDKLKDKQPILQELFDDLAFQKETYPLELMSMLVQSNFDPKDREIQKLLARTKTGTSTTKDILESAFSHLQSISARHNKNRKMGLHSKWLYTTASPYSKISAPQVYPEPSDWLSFSVSDQDLIKEFAILGSVQKEKLPEYEYGQDIRFPATAHDITKRKWRNAGPTSHHNSAAAMGFMLTDVGDDFHNAIHSTWGSLFTVGGIFHHRHKDIYALSLGFRKWAAVGMKLSVQELDGEETQMTLSNF